MATLRLMKTVTAISVAIAAMFGTDCVLAQQSTLKDIAQKAILSNPEVLQRWHAYQAAINEKEAAEGGYLPRVDLVAGAGREWRDDPLLVRDYNRHSTTLSLTQMLWDGFATRNEVLRLDHARMARVFDLLDASELAALEASRAYLDVLRYRKLVKLAEENYVRHKAVFEQIQKKAHAGVARRVDLEQASGRLALAESNLLTETANLHDVSARFQRIVGEVPGRELASAPSLKAELPADPAELFRNMQARNPAILASIENLRSAQAAQGVRKAAYQPRVDLRLKNERGSDLNGYIGRTDNRTAEVVLSWNLFNGLSDRARARQYADLANVAKDLRDKACRDVRQTLAIAFNDTRKLSEQLTYLDQHQLATEKARDAYRKQFDIGQRTLLDLLDTENELFQAKRAYVIAEYDLSTAYVRTQAGLGNLLQNLGLTQINKEQLPPLADWHAEGDGAEFCPPEGPVLYTVDKKALDAQAVDYVRETTPAQAPSAAVAGGVLAPGKEHEAIVSLKRWAQVWSSRNSEELAGFYAPSFISADGRSRSAWLEKRQVAIGAAKQIEIELADIQVQVLGTDKVSTSFRQSYRSDSYQDQVNKTLTWQKIDGRWLIVREAAQSVAGQ